MENQEIKDGTYPRDGIYGIIAVSLHKAASPYFRLNSVQEMKQARVVVVLQIFARIFATLCASDQEMMMQIMDKYVQAGEALAWKENEVLDLTKQVLLYERRSAIRVHLVGNGSTYVYTTY